MCFIQSHFAFKKLYFRPLYCVEGNMTNLYKISLSKLACISVLILASKIVPAESDIVDDLLATAKPSSNGKSSGGTDSVPELPKDSENFRILMDEVSNTRFKFCMAIAKYLTDSGLAFDEPTLQKLKVRVLDEQCARNGGKKEKNVFNYFLENKDIFEMGSKLARGDDDTAIEVVGAGRELETALALYTGIPALVVISPVAISERLKTFIAGQDRAIDSLSILAHRYMCNKSLIESKQKPAGKPNHCILTGPTGCGKSETLRQIGNILGVPVLHINARSLTDEGYKGLNFSEVVSSFCVANNKPEFAIVAVDEIDKLAIKKDVGTKDFGQAIQRILLSCLDGNPVCKDKASYNVSNWWFVCTGAFSEFKGLHDDDCERATTAKTHEDIISYGFEPEFVGRLSEIISLEGHTLETILGVITKDGSPLSQAKNEFKRFYNIDLCFDDKALHLLAESSLKIGLGVRSLQPVLNEILRPFYTTASVAGGGRITITAKEVSPFIEKMKRDTKKPQSCAYPHMYI